MYIYTLISPIGTLAIVEDDGYIISIGLVSDTNFDNKIYMQTPLIRETRKQLQEYFNKKRTTFDIPIKYAGTPYMIKVWNVLKTIPYGTTLSYKEVALKIGNVKGCRSVGMACGKNNLLIVIPCHRVIGTNKKLTGFSCNTENNLEIKQFLLDIERYV